MKKKILFLSLILPLVFMITIFSVGRVASIIVAIPVSGIQISTQNENGFIEVDITNYRNDLYIEAHVLPFNAANQRFSYKVSGVGDAPAADIEVSSNGLLTFNGTGSAKITVTSADGGFSDSVIVTAYSQKVVSFTPTLNGVKQDKLGDGYEANVRAGLVYKFGAVTDPTALSDSDIGWTSSNSDILEINEITGVAIAKLSGKATVTAVCKNGVGGHVLTKTIEVTVTSNLPQSGIAVNGRENPTITAPKSALSVSFLVETSGEGIDDGAFSGADAQYILDMVIEALGDNQYRVTLTFVDGRPDSLNLDLNAGVGVSNIKFAFADYAFDIKTQYHTDGDEIFVRVGAEVAFSAVSEPFDEEISYNWSISGGDVALTPDATGVVCRILAADAGSITLTVNAVKEGNVVYTVTKTLTAVNSVYSISFHDSAKTYGIEGIRAVGSTVINDNGAYVNSSAALGIRVITNAGSANYTQEELIFSSSDTGVISPFATVEGFNVRVNGDGTAQITAEWKYNEYFGVDIRATITLRGVSGGVTVDTYEKLVRATEDGRRVVLSGDIMLGRENANLDYCLANSHELDTDYDWGFYENRELERPAVRYLIEFKNDIYGNGYTINADYMTKLEDSTGLPLFFKGPLDFVAIGTAAVKAQDNIVFLVRTDGVTINNISLKGCFDESLVEDGTMNLGALNYTGTVLEIKADCNLFNSRVSNGRTVVRVFGGDTTNGSPIISSTAEIVVADERINVNISGCILTRAREFILKIGSDRAVRAGVSGDDLSVHKFLRANGTSYEPYDAANATDDYFYDNYVMTDVTLENSVLATSGLFSVGMETHFAGPALMGVGSIKIENWRNLAATSYASVLRLRGDVRLLDWKLLGNVDSSTLIETTADAREFLKLNVAAMLEKVNATSGEYKDIITNIDGASYVHGGIAFYGGGYNYSYLDADGFTNEMYGKYKINISILANGIDDINDPLYLQGTMLPLAAGAGDFMFYMYNANSENNYRAQVSAIEDGSAYIVTAKAVVRRIYE